MTSKSRKSPVTISVKKTPRKKVPQDTGYQTFVVFAFSGSTSGLKTPVANEDEAREILNQVMKDISNCVVFYDEKKGILIDLSHLSHAFIAVEPVQSPDQVK